MSDTPSDVVVAAAQDVFAKVEDPYDIHIKLRKRDAASPAKTLLAVIYKIDSVVTGGPSLPAVQPLASGDVTYSPVVTIKAGKEKEDLQITPHKFVANMSLLVQIYDTDMENGKHPVGYTVVAVDAIAAVVDVDVSASEKLPPFTPVSTPIGVGRK